MSTLTQLSEEFTALKEEIRSQFKDQVSVALKEMFIKFPELESIRWVQYTPYFNDGDPCEFSMGDFHVITEGADPKEWDDEDEDSPYAGEYVSTYRKYNEKWSDELYNELCMLSETLGGPLEDFMEDVFGDHVWVKVTRDGIKVEEYDHD